MSIKSFLTKKYVGWKMKDVPAAQRDMLMGMMEKNPDLMTKIGEEIERRKKGGESETKAAMEVMKKYRNELSGLIQR